MYRLNLYRGNKLTRTEIVEASLEEAKELAVAAIGTAQAHRAELVNGSGSVVFQRGLYCSSSSHLNNARKPRSEQRTSERFPSVPEAENDADCS